MTNQNETESMVGGDLLNRVMPVRAVDIVLALLQAAFAQEDLADGANPFRFNPRDAKNSRVWICDPDSRIDTERDARRMLITVTRGELIPTDSFQHNFAGGDMHGTTELSDLVAVPIEILCEAGTRTSVEVLAHACYSIVKLFRRQLLKDYGITNLRVLGVGSPQRTTGIPGDPWVCTVSLRCEYQERGTMTELANSLNYLNVTTVMKETLVKKEGPPPPVFSASAPAPVTESTLLDRVMPIRAVDTILALLQAAFGQENLMGDGNLFCFNRNDPKSSRVWINDPDARVDTMRDGRRMLVTVSRGELTPAEAHMNNYAGGDMRGTQEFTDIVSVPITIQCEAGTRSMAEILAHACYSVVKLFRRQLLKDYNILNIRVLGLLPPQRTEGVPGDPWLCSVLLRCEYQERSTMTTIGNNLNYVNLGAVLRETSPKAGGPPPPVLAPPAPAFIRESSELFDRVMPVRAVDIVLALLQSAFGLDNLMGEGNPLRFNRNDPKNSRVWICDPDARIDSPRDGRRMMVTVTRGDLSPYENHQHNFAGGDMHGMSEFTDMLSVPVSILCEAGNRSMVELLAHVCYSIMKLFRWELYRDYGISGITVVSLSAPMRTEGIPGDPWLCAVTVRCEYQERSRMTVDANALNYLNVNAAITKALTATPAAELTATVTQGVRPVEVEFTDRGQEFTVWSFEIFMSAGGQEDTITLAFTAATPGAEIYYVEGNRDPTMLDMRYSGPILITAPGRHYFTARAFKVGMLPSPSLHVSYDLKP